MISQISSVSFLVYTLLCVGSWNTDSWGVWSQTGGVLGGKISLSGMQTSIRQKRPTFRIPYFRPLHVAARGGCPLRPLLPPLYVFLSFVRLFVSLSVCVWLTAGPFGRPGPPGATGIPGNTGFFGATGFTGHTGIPGSVGLRGNVGAPGGPGAVGPPGSAGQRGTFTCFVAVLCLR